jgi:hypothetical protein
MPANDTDRLDEQFAALLEQGAEAVAAGSPWYPEDNPAIPVPLLPALQKARRCLELLHKAWPRSPAPGQTTEAETPAPGAGGDRSGQRVGRYTLMNELGRGGMGVVYKAWQADLHRPVALKMVLAGAHAGTQARERFRREAELAAALRHPHIVQVHEVGEHDGCPYFSQEFMDGGSLGQLVAGRPVPPREAARIVETLARAVHYPTNAAWCTAT